jgi:hypothetical protein
MPIRRAETFSGQAPSGKVRLPVVQRLVPRRASQDLEGWR